MASCELRGTAVPRHCSVSPELGTSGGRVGEGLEDEVEDELELVEESEEDGFEEKGLRSNYSVLWRAFEEEMQAEPSHFRPLVCPQIP